MPKTSARKKSSKQPRRKPKGKPAPKAATRGKTLKARARTSARGKAARVRPSESGALRENGARDEGKAAVQIAPTAAPPAPLPKPARLLKDSKSTSAALGLLEKAIKLIHQREFRKARLELESLVDLYPGEAEIAARARTYIQICLREEAARQKRPPTNDELYALGVLEHNRGNYDAAIAYFRQSLERRPDSDYILYSLAASLALKGEPEAALECLKKAIDINEDNRVYAKNDSDFACLQDRADFSALLGLNPARPGAARRP